MLLRSLLALDDASLFPRLAPLLGDRALHVRPVHRAAELWDRLRRGGLDLVVVERRLLGKDAVSFLEGSRADPEAPEVVFLVWQEDAALRARLLAGGALAVLSLETDDELLRQALEAVLARVETPEPAHVVLSGSGPSLADFRSSSPKMRALVELVERVVGTDATLLVTGETGVGKEWLAKAVHGASPRVRGPFVAVNCAAIPAALLESELFGHERGAFTGAIRTRRGCFEVAHGGTLLLDEIGDMPMQMQAKLLRVLQEREIQPIGSEDVIRVDVRVLAATNSDLSEAVGRGSFRSDLYYRLGVVELAIPPLRERLEDLPELVARYARDIGMARRGVPFRVAEASLAKMAAYRWPGNLRELANVIERAILLAKSDVLVAADLAIEVDGDEDGAVDLRSAVRPAAPLADRGSPEVVDLASVRRSAADRAERAYLAALLQACGGRVGETAERAGVSTRALRTRMRRFGLRKEDFRAVKPS